MDKYDEKAKEVYNGAGQEGARPYFCVDRIAQALREAAAEAFREAAAGAQIEVNACRHHSQVTKGANKRLHQAAQGVAQVIVYNCTARAAALAPQGKEK